MECEGFALKALEKTMIVLIIISVVVMCGLIVAAAIPPVEYVVIEEAQVPTGAFPEESAEVITIDPIQLETPGYVCRDDCDCMEETIPSSMPSGEQDVGEVEFPIVTV